MNKFVQAATRADWQQVVLNGGAPCFHLSPDLLTGGMMPAFCLRAERWEGHRDDRPNDYPYHRFVSLVDLLSAPEVTPIMNQDALAHRIAREIFSVGEDRGCKVHRIQFMTGNLQVERGMGGLCEAILESVIRRVLYIWDKETRR